MKVKNKVVAGLLIVSTILTSTLIYPTKADAANTGTGIAVKTEIQYVETDYSTYNSAWGNQEKVPEKEGYLFGGWYADAEGNKVIQTKEQVKADEKVFAKFVPAYVLSVKAQNNSSTKETDSNTSTRLVSSVDCRQYESVGFVIKDMEDNGRIIASEPIEKVVYKYLGVKNSDNTTTDYSAEQIFGTVTKAKAQRLFVLTLTGIPDTKWNSDIYVQPYWVTYDGVKVYGLGKYVYVRDGLDGWISVPVNLHTGASVGAGLVSVEFDNTKLQYQECRAGSVFEKVVTDARGNTVNCIGNVNEIENVPAQDMYITLRFKVLGDYKLGSGMFLNFNMKKIEFCNVAEEFVPMNILNVQY